MHVVLRLRAENRPATEAEQQVLQQWTGWGATPYLFDERKKFAATFAAERAHLRDILSQDEYAKARSSTLNAHYTDPVYARVVWQALRQFGVPAGAQLRVLEPGVGAGRFLADAPADAEIVGVEVDPITAAVAQALYPSAQILTESFADTRPPEEDFDLVIGNVPFGKYKLRDPKHNPGRRQSIHNHFILKSLELTRPGGIVALITSRYTLDGTDEAREAREQMAAVADLLGAVRLPSNSHQDAAGTNVVMDLLIFRRRAEGETPAAADWLTVEPAVLPGARPGVAAQPIEINNYFVQHPQMVLGTPKADVVRYGPKLVVEGKPQAEAALRTALDHLAQQAQDSGRAFTERLVFHGTLEKYDGLLELGPDGTFTEIRNGRPVPHVPAKSQARELRELIGLRDIAVALLDEESENHLTTPRMTQLRGELNRRYDAYVTRFGPINRFKVNNRPSADGTPAEEAAERRTYPRMGGFRNDPFAPYVLALENFDEDTQTAKKADLFAKRVVAPPEPLKRADSPEDAALICWDQHNDIRLDTVAALLGLDSEQAAREALGTLVYDDPDGGLIRRMEYLSGNVRRKLAAAEQAAAKDPKYAVNVEALSEVIPRDLQPAEIESRLGAAWVSAKYVQEFLREILEDDDVKVSNLGARWSVKGGDTGSLLARTVWGTQARSAQALASNLLNNQEILVTKKLPPDGPTVTDTKATAFALAKSKQLDDRFRMWLWEDPDRAETLLRYYNNRYNAIVPPNYTGVQITAPGLSKAYTLHPHQKAAVARIRATKTGVGLYHGTGAGKTLEMIVGGMELTRLGLAKKPVYAVPKGVLGQFQREFLQAYPRARILVADSSDLTGERRHQFVARWSTGNWDAVIISHTAFKKIPMSKAARLDYISQEVKRLEAHLENADGGDKFTVKDIENQIATLKGRIEDEIKTPGDSGVEFERTGSTYIFYDEAHTLKNLRVISSIRELALEGNQITADMDMKLSYLRKNYGGRVTTQATATPVDNSPMEILTAIKYLAPDLLRDEWGIEEDDQFVSTFIQPVNRVEMSPDGNSFSTRARYARYVNQTELKRVLFSIADVKLKRDLQLGEPAIIGGEMRILEVDASPELRTVMQSLGTRMMGIRLGDPALKYNRKGRLVEDNTLWISTDGRLASLDVRLVNRSTSEPQKVDVAADEIFRLWQLHKDDVFYDEDGNEEPNRGSLILGFCDLGVPAPDKEFVFYEALREALTSRGMPGSLIRFDQEAKNPQQKARLDKDAREGRVAVLVGSRSGLGTGRNLQKRVIGVIQIDPTWKATPIIQSLGRGKRQGNQHKAIHHIAIVTKKSYDPFLWQKVATKQAFAEAILDVNDTSRILEAAEDGDDGRIPAGVMFAVAADKPELEELERVEGRLAKLRLDQQMWHDEQFAYQVTGEQGRRRVQDLKARIQEAGAAMERRTDTRGDAFTMTVEGHAFDERREAGEALAQRLERLARASVATGMQKDAVVGELGGFLVVAVTQRAFDGMYVQLYFRDAPVDEVRLTASGLANQDRVGLIRRLENTLDSLESVHAKAQEHIARIETNIERAKELVGKPFPQQAELDKVTAEHRKLTKALGVHGAAEAGELEAHDKAVTEDGTDLVDAAVHDLMVMAGGTSDGWVEVDPATITSDDLSDTTRSFLDALANTANTRNGPTTAPAASGVGSSVGTPSEQDRGSDRVALAPYADEATAVTGEAAVLAAFAVWQDLDVVDGMSGRGQQLARQMDEAGITLAEALEQERTSVRGESGPGGGPWALGLCRELARTSGEFLSFLDSPNFKLNEAGRAMRDRVEQVVRAAIEHTLRVAPLTDRRRPAPPTPAGPSPARPSTPTASGPFAPDRWYQHTMLGGALSDSRGTFLNDIVQQLGQDGSDVTIEPGPTGTVVITGPLGPVTVTPLTEEFPASVAPAYEDAIERLLQDAQHALRANGQQAGDLFDDWLSSQLHGPARNLRAALVDDEEAAFRQAMRVRFYAISPWAHPDTAERPQPASRSRQEDAADETDAPQRSREHVPEQASGGAISVPVAEPVKEPSAGGGDRSDGEHPADTSRTAQESPDAEDLVESVPTTTPQAATERPWSVPTTPYADRSEYWSAEEAALTAYRRWARDHARRLATVEQEEALTAAADTAIASSRTGRMARLLGMDVAPEWTHLQRLADQCRAVVEQWEREDGRSTEGNWEVFTGLRDHASRCRSTVEDLTSDTYRRWAGSAEPLTLGEDAVEFIPGILPWDQYVVAGPQGLRAGPVSGRELAAGLAQLIADGTGVEETQDGLVVFGPIEVQFSVQLAAAQPSTPVPPPTETTTPAPQPVLSAAPSPEPDPTSDPQDEPPVAENSTPLAHEVGAGGDGFVSALPQVADLSIVLGGYADAAELVAGRRYTDMAAEQLQRVLARHEGDPPGPKPAHQQAAAAAAAVIESEPTTSADVFSLYDRLAETAVQLADDPRHEVSTAAQKAAQYTERHLARMQARRNDLADLFLDADDLDEDHTAVLDHDDPLRLTALWYQDSAEIGRALTDIFDTFPKWPHAYDDHGGPYSDQLRGAMLLLRRPHDTVASALTDWMQVTSCALGAAQEAEDGVSRYTLRDLARRTFQHHQRLAAHELGLEQPPYEDADAFVGGANKAESAWNWWMASDTAKALLDGAPEGSAAREALDAVRDSRYAADFVTLAAETLDEVDRRVTAMAHAAYDLVLSLDTRDYRHPQDAKRLGDLVRHSYEHAVACRASNARPETVAAVRAGVAQRRLRLEAERGPAPEPEQTTASNAALEIEHHYRGTVVRGTTAEDTDAPVRAVLDNLKFKWSRNKGFWYLKRNLSQATRDVRVRKLTAELTRLGRPYRMVEEPGQETAPEIVIPVGEPYASKEEAQHDFWEMYGALSGLKETPAGRRLIGRGLTDQGVQTRPDGQAVWLAMEELCDGPVGRVSDPFAHPAATVVERCTQLAHTVLVLAHNLEEERYRAPVVMARFRTMKQHAVQLASRITASAQQAADWQEMFGTPALPPAQSTDAPPEPVGQEPAPGIDVLPHPDGLESEPPLLPTAEEGAPLGSEGEAVPRPEPASQQRIEITMAARSAAGHLLVNVALPADRGNAQEVPDLRSADVPGLVLPAHTALPLLVRPAKLSDALVSDEEVEAWLDEHLPASPIAPAWNSPAVRAVIQQTVRDALRDSMAPDPEDVAAWLVSTASENRALIQAAHANQQADFLPIFATAADQLIADGGSEHLLWTYLKEDGRRDVLHLAAPRVHRELRQQALEPVPPEQGPSVPEEQPAVAPGVNESERERKRAEFQAENTRWATEMREDARQRAVRAAIADDHLRALLTDGRSREESRQLFTDWLSHADLSATGTEGDRFRDWFRHTRQAVEDQYANVAFNEVYETVSAAQPGQPAGADTTTVESSKPSAVSPHETTTASHHSNTAESPEMTESDASAGTVMAPYTAETMLEAVDRLNSLFARVGEALPAALKPEGPPGPASGAPDSWFKGPASVEIPDGFAPYTNDRAVLKPGDVVREGFKRWPNSRRLSYRTLVITTSSCDRDGYYYAAPSTRIHPREIVAVPADSRLLTEAEADTHTMRWEFGMRWNGAGAIGRAAVRRGRPFLEAVDAYRLAFAAAGALARELDRTQAPQRARDLLSSLLTQTEQHLIRLSLTHHMAERAEEPEPNPQALKHQATRKAPPAAQAAESADAPAQQHADVEQILAESLERHHHRAREQAVRAALASGRVGLWFAEAPDEKTLRAHLLDWLNWADIGDPNGAEDQWQDWFHASPQGARQEVTEQAIADIRAALIAAAEPADAVPSSRATEPEPGVVAAESAEAGNLLTPQHLDELPHHDGRRGDEDARLAILTTLSFRDGQVHDALLLLQSVEVEEDTGEDPIVRGAQIVPANGPVSTSLNGRYRPADLLAVPGSRVLPLALPVTWPAVEALAALPHDKALEQLRAIQHLLPTQRVAKGPWPAPRPEAAPRVAVAPGTQGDHSEPVATLPVVADEFSILFAADRDLLRTGETSEGQRDPAAIHLGGTDDQAGVLADPSTVSRLIDERALKLGPGQAVVLAPEGRRRLRDARLADRPLTAVGDRVLNISTGSTGIVCGYVMSVGGQFAAVAADREGWPQGVPATAYPQYLTVLEPGVMDPGDAAELYRSLAWGHQPDPNPKAPPEEAAPAEPGLGDTQHLLSASTEALTREHLRDLPRYPTRPPIDAEIQFGVVVTLSFANGEIPDAVLLLQAAEVDPQHGDILHGVLIAPDSNLSLKSRTGYTIFPRDLLHRTDARLLPLEEGLAWGQVEELVRLPYAQALGRLPLAAATETYASSPAQDLHEPVRPPKPETGPLKDLIGALGDRVSIGHIGPDNRRQGEQTPSVSEQDAAHASTSSAAADEEQQEDTVAATEPETTAPGPWTSRIKIVSDVTGTYVTGTTGAPQEDGLRELLKRGKNFKYEKGRWRYAGMRGQKEQVLDEVRAFLAARDAQEHAVTTVTGGKYPPTAQQQAIITAAVGGKNVAVQALAGTGKTSTLVMIAAQMLERRIGYIAFNRAIADEAGQKFGRNVTARTSHAFARQDLRNTPYRHKASTAGRNSGARRPKDVAAALGITAELRVGDPEGNVQHVGPEEIAKIVMGAVRRYRQSADAELGRQHLGEKWAHVPAARTLLDYARRAWADIADPNSNKIVFEHDDYLKIWALGNPRLNFDTIFFDEAQDINPVLKKVIQDQDVQIIVVGDSNQAIYEFRGAIDALKDWPADVVLPLTQSWRFGPAVAEAGNAYLALLASDLRLEGSPALDTVLGLVDEPDAILTHTNVGAISAVFAGFEAGKRVALVGGGRDIEDIALAARDLQQGRRTAHPELSAFENWSEVKEYAESDEDAQTLQTFVRLVDRYTPQGLINMIRDLVPEEARAEETRPELVVSTAHKSKGREWDQVQIWSDFPQPKEDTKTGELLLPAQDKLRLAYVTVTRARQRLDIGSLGWIHSVGSLADAHPAQITAAPAPEQAAPAPATAAVPEPPLPPVSIGATEIAPPTDVPEDQPGRTVTKPAAEVTPTPAPPPAAEPAAPAPTDEASTTTEPDTPPTPQVETGPEEQPETTAPTLQDPGEPLTGADQPSLFAGPENTSPAHEQAPIPAATPDTNSDIAPLPWDDEKIKKRGTAGIRRGQKKEIPNLAREMREALGENQVRDVWEMDNPWAQFEENLRHTQSELGQPDSALNTLVTEAAAQLRTQIDQLAAQAFNTFEAMVQACADAPDQLAELDTQFADAHRLPELTDPLVRQALIACLEAVDAIERIARNRKVRAAGARDALEQVMGLAGTSYSPDGQQIWPNLDAALAPVKVQVDRARERIADLSDSTVTEQYARLRALIAAHEAQPAAESRATDVAAAAPEAAESTVEPPASVKQEERVPEPLNDRDIGAVLSKISPWHFGKLIFELDQTKRATPQLYEGWLRLPSEPGYNEAGNEFASAFSASGAFEIEVKTADDAATVIRAGRLTLAKSIAWLKPGMPPERRQLVAAAWRSGNAMSRSDLGFEVLGESGRWKVADGELGRILSDSQASVIKAALEAHLTGTAEERVARIRAAETWDQGQTLPLDFGGMEDAFADIATLERVNALRAVLPDRRNGVRRLGEVEPGDCLTGVSDERLPFIVRERPVVSDDNEVSLVGELVVGLGELRTYMWETGRRPDDHVEPLLLPQSLAGLVDVPADAPLPGSPAPADPVAVPDVPPAAELVPQAATPAVGSSPAEHAPAPPLEDAPRAAEQQPAALAAAEAAPPASSASIGERHLPYETQAALLNDLYATEGRYEAWANSATGRLLLSEARELQEETGVADSNEAARIQTAFRNVVHTSDTTRSSADAVLRACRDLHTTVAEAGRSLAARTAFVSEDDRLLLLAVYSQAQEQLARLEATESVQALLDSAHEGASLFSRFTATRPAQSPSASETPEPAPAQEPRAVEPQTAAAAPLPQAGTAAASDELEPVPLEANVPHVDSVELPEVLEESTPEPAPAAEADQELAGPATSEPAVGDDGFDFWTDVIGDDLVVNGVVYSSSEWEPDPEDGVRRRRDEDDEPVSAEELAGLELDEAYEALIREEHMAATEAVPGQPEVAQPEVPGQDDFDRHFEDIVALLRSAEPPAGTQAPIPRPRFSAEDEQHLREQYAATRQALSGILTSIDADPILPVAEDPAVEAGDAAALEAAMSNAQTEAGYYWGTPEWAMIRSIGQAGQQLRGSVREALLTYAETTLGDIRAHGINRTIEARTARAISHGAMLLARRLERSGQRDSRGWRAVWGLHRAAATRADRLTGLLPAGQRTDLAGQLGRAWQWFSERLSARSERTGTSTDDTGTSTSSDEPGRVRAMLSNGVESIGRLYGAVSERLGNLAQHPAWRRIASLWTAVRDAVRRGWLGVGRFMADRQTMGAGRALWLRTLEIISSGAQALINRLDANGGRDGLRWNLLRVLRHAAEDHIAHLHGHLPEEVSTPLGTYESAVDEAAEQAPTAAEGTAPQEPASEGPSADGADSPPGDENPVENSDLFRAVVLQVAARDYTLAMDLSYGYGVSAADADILLTRMEELGVVGPQGDGGVREVLVTPGEAESLLDASPAADRPAPRWQPVNEPLTPAWFDEVRTAVRSDVQRDRGLSRRDLMSLLGHENARPGNRADAGLRANESVDLFLQGRGAEVPQHLAGEGFAYVRGEANRDWALREATSPAVSPSAASGSAEAEADQQAAAGQGLPRRRRQTPTDGPSRIEQAAAGSRRQPAPTAGQNPAVAADTFTVQAQRMQDRADFARAAATSPAEERAAGVLQTIAANSRATADRIAGAATPDGGPLASGQPALTVEAFLAALRTTAQAQGAQIPDDLLASAMEAAHEAVAAAAPSPAGSAAAGSRPTRRGQAEREQAEHRLPGQHSAPGGVGRR
ncbi:UvrD-helicase domain-containing protein [Streptomyces sp. NPDC047072]|uniref:UvrD-helicase domain-containing protein n=1 Tax=Streptomyces sp. NPDC047072 TaxID=3154809 RepID=UPI0033C6DE5A